MKLQNSLKRSGRIMKKEFKKNNQRGRRSVIMDIATPAGLLIGFVLLVVSVIMGGGASGITAFINIPSMMIVVGGTICATLVRYPLQRGYRCNWFNHENNIR